MQAEYGSAAACVDDSKANAHQTNSSSAFKNSVDDRAFSSTKAFCDLPDCDVSCWKANSGRCGRLCFCLCDPLRWDVTGSECLASSAGPIYVHGKHAGVTFASNSSIHDSSTILLEENCVGAAGGKR